MYNPDAVAHWLFEKYPQLFAEAVAHADVQLPLHCMMPSVTPVNFGTMYTGAAPAVHGITKYAKPVIRIDTFYDALLRAGKKPVILAVPTCSMGNIFLEREMDYILCKTWDEVNAKAARILVEDQHDVVIIYNGNYDSRMHKTGPESIESLGELRHNVRAFAMFSEMVKNLWGHHNTFMGFAMDHGCHEIDGGAGAHGLDMSEDINILHMYKAYPATKA
jgi:predicted AlkP superfamily pyrophosphatase or phosphodiesterase